MGHCVSSGPRWAVLGRAKLGHEADSSLIIVIISTLYASLVHYIRNFDRRIAITLFTDSKSAVNPAERRQSMGVGLLSADGGAGRRTSLIPPNQSGYAAIETGAGRMGM